MTDLIAHCMRRGRLTAEALNNGDWVIARQHADILRELEAVDRETADQARIAFADSFAIHRRFSK